MNPGLVIFDCDGVLIDSELLVCGLVSEELTRLGYPLTTEEVIARYAGRPEPDMVTDIEANWGQSLPPAFFERVKARTLKGYAETLQPIAYVREVVSVLAAPYCVASSSAPPKLRLGLQSAGLLDLFEADLVSASLVARGKPAPDVFIYAAGRMRVETFACVVVEDSVPGVRAARAAGMRAFGFSGGNHCRPGHGDRLVEAGAERSFSDLRDLPGLLAGSG